jgi:uncharacterized protein (DUF2336 family)
MVNSLLTVGMAMFGHRCGVIPPRLSPATSSSRPMTHFDQILFSAAGAFVGLQRPGREDATRLDAMAMPLYAALTLEGKRRIAAVLSECRAVIPAELVTALACETLDVAASLLISRAEIPDSILETVIAACGEGHARIIGLRANISVSVKDRIDALIERIAPMTTIESTPLPEPKAESVRAEPAVAIAPPVSDKLEETQSALRRMMLRQTIREDVTRNVAFEGSTASNLVARLINLALAGDPDFLATAIADEWRAPFAPIRSVVRRAEMRTISRFLKGMELGPTDAFAIVAALKPGAFSRPEAIAAFYLAFQNITDAELSATRSTLDVEAEAIRRSA